MESQRVKRQNAARCAHFAALVEAEPESSGESRIHRCEPVSRREYEWVSRILAPPEVLPCKYREQDDQADRGEKQNAAQYLDYWRARSGESRIKSTQYLDRFECVTPQHEHDIRVDPDRSPASAESRTGNEEGERERVQTNG